MAKEISATVTELEDGIFQIKTKPPGCNVYLIRGSDKNVLIDTSTADSLPEIKEGLKTLGIRTDDIDLIILTHEHFDHIGAATFLYETSIVAAHGLAANKIELQDEFTTLNYKNGLDKPLRVHIWLEDGTIIDLGNYQLQTIYTPGHTSGCICVYEATKKILFSGDTVFSGGTVSDIRSSGNASDYYNSLQRLSSFKIEHLYPAHGKLSDNPDEDIAKALERTHSLFEETKILFEALSQKVLRKHQGTDTR